MIYALALGCFVMSFPTAILRHKGREKLRYISKITAALLFCATAFLAAVQRTEPMNFQATLMLVGLVMGFMGDVVLGLDRFVRPEGRGNLMLIGGFPFFFGHVAYIVALLSFGNLNPWLLLIVPFTIVCFWLINKKLPIQKYLTPFMFYALVLSGLMISTLGIAISQWGTPLGHIMLLPGLLFTMSDVSLLFDRFYGEKKRGEKLPIFYYLVAIPYFSAQALFALSISYL